MDRAVEVQLIGQPGELTRLRQEYLEQLAATIGDVKLEGITPRDLEVATLVDACSWAIISHAIQLGSPVPDEAFFIEIICGAVQPYLNPARSDRAAEASSES